MTKNTLNISEKIQPSRRYYNYEHIHKNRSTKYTKPKVTDSKEEIADFKIIVGNFDPPFAITNKTRQKINKEIEDLHNTTSQLELIDIYGDRALHHTAIEYTFFRSAYVTFSSIDHRMEHKTNLNKY